MRRCVRAFWLGRRFAQWCSTPRTRPLRSRKTTPSNTCFTTLLLYSESAIAVLSKRKNPVPLVRTSRQRVPLRVRSTVLATSDIRSQNCQLDLLFFFVMQYSTMKEAGGFFSCRRARSSYEKNARFLAAYIQGNHA